MEVVLSLVQALEDSLTRIVPALWREVAVSLGSEMINTYKHQSV